MLFQVGYLTFGNKVGSNIIAMYANARLCYEALMGILGTLRPPCS